MQNNQPSLQEYLFYDLNEQYKSEDHKKTAAKDSFEDLDDECYDDFDYESCFTVNFPIQVEMPDESIVSGNSEDELYDLIEAWYDQNPDEDDDPEIVFPISVTLASDGSTVQVNDEETLESLLYSCFGDDFEYEIYATQGSTKTLVTMEERRALKATQSQ